MIVLVSPTKNIAASMAKMSKRHSASCSPRWRARQTRPIHSRAFPPFSISTTDAHETLYHFHQPASEEEANRWLARFIRTYNLGEHRSERHSRIDDWLGHLPAEGVRQMCAWERFC